MESAKAIQVFLLPQRYQGHEALGSDWSRCLKKTRSTLQDSGFEDQDSSDELFIFSYDHPSIALASMVRCLEAVKNEYNATLAGSPLPIKIIFHLREKTDAAVAFSDPGNAIWDMLDPEAIYITRQLKPLWEQQTSMKQLPRCLLKSEGEGLSRLEILDMTALEKKALLPHRDLPAKGAHKECFYCGMRSHTPASCPAKLLTLEIKGLALVGYLPFETLADYFKKVFSNQGKIIPMIAAGVTPEQLRKDPRLQVYTGFLDIYKIYQPRFLWNVAFNIYTKWEHLSGNYDKLNIDNKNLRHGLDCIRVGQYGQAEEFLMRECKHNAPKRFYATIGLGFLALERGRLADMGNHLELANNTAVHEKERIYIALLLSRYYDLMNEPWRARDIIKNIISFKPDCMETQYRKIQLEVRGNFTDEAFNLLRSLSIDNPELYMSVLMDPVLTPIQSKAEDILATQYYTLTDSAATGLAQARNEIEELKNWFKEDDPGLEGNVKAFENLEKRFERKSYYDVRDVATRSKGLIGACKMLKSQKLDAIYQKGQKCMARWSGYHHFWNTYPYQGFFKKYLTTLLPIKKKLHLVQKLAKQNRAEEYHQALMLLEQIDHDLKEIRPIYDRMNWAKFFLASFVNFAKKLVVVEIVLVILIFGLISADSLLPDNGLFSFLGRFNDDALFQKKMIFFATTICAPLISIAITMTTMENEK